MPTHSEILGVRDDASRREVNAAYRKLAKKYHPDVDGGDSERFQQITDAYNALTERPARAAVEARKPARPAPPAPAPAPAFGLRQWIAAFLRRRAFGALSAFTFLIGLFLLDWGDGIHEDFTPGLLLVGSAAILLSVGFFANRRREYVDLADAVERAIISIGRFLFDLIARLYLMMTLVFAVVALLGAINWVKRHFLHLLPLHF